VVDVPRPGKCWSRLVPEGIGRVGPPGEQEPQDVTEEVVGDSFLIGVPLDRQAVGQGQDNRGELLGRQRESQSQGLGLALDGGGDRGAHLAPAGFFLILASWPLSLAGTVRRHARHVMMVMTKMVGADLHTY